MIDAATYYSMSIEIKTLRKWIKRQEKQIEELKLNGDVQKELNKLASQGLNKIT